MSNSTEASDLVTLSLRIPQSLHDRLVALQAQQAKRNGKMNSRNALIVSILEERVTPPRKKRSK